jgi:predicted PurR-regulated permease PerM
VEQSGTGGAGAGDPAGVADPGSEEPQPDDSVDLAEMAGAAVGAVERMPPWVPRAIALGFLFYLGLSVGAWLLGRLQDLLIMVLVSLFVSFALEPAVNYLERQGWRRGVATAAVFFGGLALVGGFTFVIGKVVVDEAAQLIDSAPQLVEDLADYSNETFGTDLRAEELSEELTREGGPVQNAAAGLADNAVSLSARAVSVLFQLLTIGLFSFYLVVDAPRLRRAICSTLPPARQRQVIDTWELAVAKTGGYLYSRALLALVSTAFHWAAFSVIELKYAPALAVFVGIISQFVPVIGTYIAGAMPAVVALANEPVDTLWVIGIVAVYQQIENYLLAPRVTAHTMELHPAVAFGAVLAGGSVLGTPGVLLALPAAAVIQAIASASVARHPVVDSDMTSLARRPPGSGASVVLAWVRRHRRPSGDR